MEKIKEREIVIVSKFAWAMVIIVLAVFVLFPVNTVANQIDSTSIDILYADPPNAVSGLSELGFYGEPFVKSTGTVIFIR